MSCAVIFTRGPSRITEPSRIASTPSSLAISGIFFRVPRYPITDVREVTRQLPNLARRVVSSSVIASAKYSCPESPDRFVRGRTARERTRLPAFGISNDRACASNQTTPPSTRRDTAATTGQRRTLARTVGLLVLEGA